MFLDTSYSLIQPENPGEFFQEAFGTLFVNESLNALILSLANQYQFYQGNFPFAAYCEDGQHKVFALLSEHNTRLRFICSPTHSFDMLNALVRGCLGEGHLPDSVVAEAETAKLLKACFAEAGYGCETHFHQGVYRCKVPKAPGDISQYELHLANKEQLETLSIWVHEFSKQAMSSGDPVDARALADERIEKGSLFLLAHKGAYVSMASWSRPLPNSASVNLVYTPPDQRGKGFAKAMVYLLTNHLLSEGGFKETNLYTDLENAQANMLYTKVGYEMIGRSEMFGVGKL